MAGTLEEKVTNRQYFFGHSGLSEKPTGGTNSAFICSSQGKKWYKATCKTNDAS